jgi:hypothetical protein
MKGNETNKFLPVQINLLERSVDEEVIVKHYWRVLYDDFKESPISIISSISFHLNRWKNGKRSSSSEEHLRNQNQ